MGHTQDTPHMEIADMEDTITELEQENRELQISCDGFAEECSKLEAKIHNIEEGLRRLELYLRAGGDINFDSLNGNIILDLYICHESELDAPTLADLIDAILTGGE